MKLVEKYNYQCPFLLTHILWFSDPSSVDCGPGRASLVVPASRVDAVGLPLRFVVERLALCRIVQCRPTPPGSLSPWVRVDSSKPAPMVSRDMHG